jgi:hypothetical protein
MWLSFSASRRVQLYLGISVGALIRGAVHVAAAVNTGET